LLWSVEASAGARLGFAEDVKAVEMSEPHMPVVERSGKALARACRDHEDPLRVWVRYQVYFYFRGLIP